MCLLCTSSSVACSSSWCSSAAATEPQSSRFSCSATSCRSFAARSGGRASRRTTGSCWRPSAGCCPAAAGPRSRCGRRRSWPGIAGLSRGAGPTRTDAQAGRRSAVTCASWCCGSRARTRAGAICGSPASCASPSRRLPCATSLPARAYLRRRGAMCSHGAASFGHMASRSSPATSSPSTPSGCAASTCSRSSPSAAAASSLRDHQQAGHSLDAAASTQPAHAARGQ